MDDTEPQTAAAKVLWHFTMSLDGFVAGPEHDMDWLTGFAVRPGLIEEYTRTTGAVLAGRDGFDSAVGDARPYGGGWQARSSYSRTTLRTPGRPTASPSSAARSRRRCRSRSTRRAGRTSRCSRRPSGGNCSSEA